VTRVPEQDDGSEKEPDVDLWDDVSFFAEGRKRYGTITALRGPLVEVTLHGGGPALWLDGHQVEVL
jgi:hypothetical protein